jgi:hypothetical protein
VQNVSLQVHFTLCIAVDNYWSCKLVMSREVLVEANRRIIVSTIVPVWYRYCSNTIQLQHTVATVSGSCIQCSNCCSGSLCTSCIQCSNCCSDSLCTSCIQCSNYCSDSLCTSCIQCSNYCSDSLCTSCIQCSNYCSDSLCTLCITSPSYIVF